MFGDAIKASLLAIAFCGFGCMLSSDETVAPQLEETSQEIAMACQYPQNVTSCESCNGNNTCHVCCTKLATADQALCNANCDDLWPPPKPVPTPKKALAAELVSEYAE